MIYLPQLTMNYIVKYNFIFDEYTTPAVPSVTMHGLGAEDGVYQRSAGAQSDPTWRHVPEGGAGGEQEELPEESSPPGGAGGDTEGETPIGLTTEKNPMRKVWLKR